MSELIRDSFEVTSSMCVSSYMSEFIQKLETLIIELYYNDMPYMHCYLRHRELIK